MNKVHISTTVSGIIIFLFIYFFFFSKPSKTVEDDIKSLTDKEKQDYKDMDKRLTPHEQDILRHPEYWGNPLNKFMWDFFNK